MMELYTSVEWSKLCAEVARLRVDRRHDATVIALHTHVERAPEDVAGLGHAMVASARK
jgi:hypothetical protein